jgi:hypothetical protein
MIKVIKDFTHTYPEDPLRNINFENYVNEGKDCVLYISTGIPSKIVSDTTVPKYWFNAEEQLYNYGLDLDKFASEVDEIFTILPDYITKRPKRRYVFFPTDPKVLDLTESEQNKSIPVIYTGGIYGPHLEEISNGVNKFNGIVLSHIPNVSYIQKLNLVKKSKISICHNLLIPLNGKCSGPQLKTRCFEAAACKTLMLVLKDDYNIIEDWFKPNEDFIYYERGNLISTIKSCLEDYDKYTDLIESAHQKLMTKYTTSNFIERYLK